MCLGSSSRALQALQGLRCWSPVPSREGTAAVGRLKGRYRGSFVFASRWLCRIWGMTAVGVIEQPMDPPKGPRGWSCIWTPSARFSACSVACLGQEVHCGSAGCHAEGRTGACQARLGASQWIALREPHSTQSHPHPLKYGTHGRVTFMVPASLSSKKLDKW